MGLEKCNLLDFSFLFYFNQKIIPSYFLFKWTNYMYFSIIIILSMEFVSGIAAFSNIINSISQDSLYSFCQFLKYPSRKYKNQFQQQLSQLTLDLQNQNHLNIVNSLLQMPSKYRSSQVLQKLNQLFGRIQYFQKICEKQGQRYKNKILTHMNSQIYKIGQRITKVGILFLYTGQQSDRFFIILKGQVAVLYCRDPKQIQKQTLSLKKELLKQLSKKDRILSRIQNHYFFKGIYIQTIQEFQSYFNSYGIPTHYVQNILIEGKAFGQLGIIYKQKRMANIIAKQCSLIGTISADKYLNIMAQNQQKSINQTLKFLQQHFYSQIRNMDLEKAQRYFYLFSSTERKVNSQIYTSKKEVTGFYIILEGSVVLKTENNDVRNYSNNKFTKHYSYLRQIPKRRFIQIKNLLYGQSFGLQQVIEVLKNDKQAITYKYTAVTTAHTKLLFCPLNKLIKLVKYDKNLIRQLQQKIQIKHNMNWFNTSNIQAVRNLTEYKNDQIIQNQKINLFPKRYVIQHINSGQIRSPAFSNKLNTLTDKVLKRRPQSAVQKYMSIQNQNKQQKKSKNEKLWKNDKNEQSLLVINILNDRMKLNERMKEQSWGDQKKRVVKKRQQPYMKYKKLLK